MTDASSPTRYFIPVGEMAKPTYSQPSMDLRIYNGRLQQQFQIGSDFNERGTLIWERLEWRDVPVIDEQETTA